MTEYTQSESLRKHMLAVEASVAATRGSGENRKTIGLWWRCCMTLTTSAGPTRRTIHFAVSRFSVEGLSRVGDARDSVAC
jgi:hypothetical protein